MSPDFEEYVSDIEEELGIELTDRQKQVMRYYWDQIKAPKDYVSLVNINPT